MNMQERIKQRFSVCLDQVQEVSASSLYIEPVLIGSVLLQIFRVQLAVDGLDLLAARNCDRNLAIQRCIESRLPSLATLPPQVYSKSATGAESRHPAIRPC